MYSLWVALVSSRAVDAKCLTEGGAWEKRQGGELYVGIFEDDYDGAVAKAARKAEVAAENIRLIQLVPRGGM